MKQGGGALVTTLVGRVDFEPHCIGCRQVYKSVWMCSKLQNGCIRENDGEKDGGIVPGHW